MQTDSTDDPMQLFISTKKTISRTLLSIGISTIGLTSAISTASGTTLARSQNSLQFTNFSHAPEEVSPFQSAFAYVLTQNNFAIIKSDPMFVTGVPLSFHPLAPQYSALSTSTPGENSVAAPFEFNSVTGGTLGHNTFTYSDSIPDRLSSVNLSSASTFSVNDTAHFVSTVGQSGFNISFLLQPDEKFTFDFYSSSQLETLTNWSSTTTVEETQVIYFFTQPVGVDINNGVLRLSLYPQLNLSGNDDRIDTSLLELTSTLSPNGDYSRIVNYNGSSEESSPYFKLSTRQNAGDDLRGTFEYTATRPTIFTAVAYTSSAASSSSTKIPESSLRLSIIYFSFILIGAKLFKLLLF